MEKWKIGENAGKVWHALNDLEKISIPELARKLDLSEESTVLAVGWLARENQVCIRKEEGLTFVSSREREKEVEFCFG